MTERPRILLAEDERAIADTVIDALRTLVEAPGRIFSRSQLMPLCWSAPASSSTASAAVPNASLGAAW